MYRRCVAARAAAVMNTDKPVPVSIVIRVARFALFDYYNLVIVSPCTKNIDVFLCFVV